MSKKIAELTKTATAEVLGVSRRTVYVWLKNGKLKNLTWPEIERVRDLNKKK